MKDISKRWSAWCFGVLISVVVVRIFSDEAIGWAPFIGVAIGGLVGTSVVMGVKRVIKSRES
ncbi:hypothetical protein H0266_14575 [Halobacillus locisalis]|uniref:Uncharacterized protein n=1 Tax=Halobacillus locisalis TaxID=220753 RepID=A0A838CWA8_9BACI|nr:hypothetical protein [Halobacillus locisalis]MBA2176119.1 hypothetical protein [Halobacillus locisalis]